MRVCVCWAHAFVSVYMASASMLYVPMCCHMRGTKNTLEFIYKKLCIYSYMFKLQSPSKHSPFARIHPFRLFFHCPKQFSNSLILTPCSDPAIICFISSTSAKRFLGGLCASREIKKPLRVRSGEQGGWVQGVLMFLVKSC